MAAIRVAEPAPPFRLPSAQGPEVALEDYRGKQNVIVWFTKGMGCVFCRAQMSQLARAAAEIHRLGAEVLEVSVSSPAQGQLYARKFSLPFPYLCDPDYRVRRDWGLGLREHGVLGSMRAFVKGALAPKPPNDYGSGMPPLAELRNVLRDDDMGFFLVDRQGVVRYALTGAYSDEAGTHPLPSNEEIVAEVAKLT